MAVRIIAVIAVVMLVTLPFGFYRAYTRKFSVRWFIAIHVPVVLVFLARYEAHLSYAFIPMTCAVFATAQILGSRTGRWWMQRRPLAVVAEDSEAAIKPGA